VSADFWPTAAPGLVAGNRLQLLESGGEYFPALIAAIDAARREVHLETYIFDDDVTGRRVAAALASAARRGVAVRVLVDGFGARDFSTGLGAVLAADGVEVMVYRPEAGRYAFRRHRLRRMHRKLAVVDGGTAFVGGINVVDDFDDGRELAPRFDYAVRIEGPLAVTVHLAVRHVWRLVRWARLGRRPPPPAELPPPPPVAGTTSAALLVRDNLRHRRDIENAYLAAIQSARQRVVIANAYFLPGRTFRKALVAAARRGVRVDLLHFATLSLYDRLMVAGIRIFEYEKAYLHAKVAVVDGDWATVGSSNIDPLSLLLAREANVVVRGAEFAAQLLASLDAAMADAAREVHHKDHRHRSWLTRVASAAAYGLVRFMVGVTRYAGNQYRG
jgi:cardiolipin synthase